MDSNSLQICSSLTGRPFASLATSSRPSTSPPGSWRARLIITNRIAHSLKLVRALTYLFHKGVFLLHFRSALIPIVTLPIAVLLSFIPMYYMGITSNIMSLGGIAIAIGEMVDASSVLTENVHKRLERGGEMLTPEHRDRTVIDALKEVGAPIFYYLLVLTVSFLPIFALQAQEGRLFKPLAYTKTFSMFAGALLAITLAPAPGDDARARENQERGTPPDQRVPP